MGLESATYIDDLNSSNPVGTTDQIKQGDDHIRLLKAAIKATFPGLAFPRYIEKARADVANSGTPALWAATTDYANLLGTTTVTGFATGTEGQCKLVRFDAVRTLTHNATTLGLPGGESFDTLAGDHALIRCRGTTSNIVVAYWRADGTALVGLSATQSSIILGRKTAGAGAFEELTIEDVMALLGTSAQGDILFKGAAAWELLAPGTAGQFLTSGGAAADPSWSNSKPSRGYNSLTSITEVATIIPYNDDTIPQITEGSEVLTATITPAKADSKIRIRFNGFGCAGTSGRYVVMALFRGATANALTARLVYTVTASNTFSLEFEDDAGGTSEITYRIRMGISVGSFYLGTYLTSSRAFGAIPHTTLTLEEVFV